jgi:hypothetical protein
MWHGRATGRNAGDGLRLVRGDTLDFWRHHDSNVSIGDVMMLREVRMGRLLRAVALVVFAFVASAAAAAPLLPDLIVWADQVRSYMYGGVFDTTTIPDRVLYRFDGALPNIGAGPLEIRDVTHPDGSQDIYQRIHDSNGSVAEQLIATFADVAPPPCCHLQFRGIAQYNLRTVAAGGGVGPVVATNDKTSMAVVDGTAYDLSLPGAPASPVYNSVSAPILGISVGWGDLYRRNLPGQWIDVTDLASGQYWFEVTVDPYKKIIESNDLNNTTQIMVNLTIPAPQIIPGDYNQDGHVDAADYTVWRDTLGQSVAAGTHADGDGDGTISSADYDVWKTHFGRTTSGNGLGASTAPEPSSLVLLFVGIAFWKVRSLLARV